MKPIKPARKKADNIFMSEICQKYTIYFVVFGSVIYNGAFFTGWQVILNLFFLVFIILKKPPVVIDLTGIFLIGLLISSVISMQASGSDGAAAIREILKYLLFPLSYIAFLNMEDRKTVENTFYNALFLLAVGGLLAMVGLTIMMDMVIPESRRLQSFLQYANSTAMLLSAGVLLSINYYTATKNKVHILYGFVMFTALILTRSRIGITVFFAVMFLYFLFQLSFRMQVYIFSLCAVASTVFLIGFHEFLRSITEVDTMAERLLTYSDAFKLIRDNPFGIGPGAWESRQLEIRSAPYYVKYVHNVYIQTALDCGMLGLICFISALINSLKGSVKNVYYFIVILIAVGSLLEIHFSFGIIIIFYTFLISGMCKERKLFYIKKLS